MSKWSSLCFVATVAIASSFSTGAFADPFGIFNLPFESAERNEARAYPSVPRTGETVDFPARFRRQIVEYLTNEAPGTIVIDAPNTYLYSFSATAERSAMAVSVVMASPGRHADDHEEGRVAGLDAASRDDCARALSAALHGRRPGQSASVHAPCISAIRSTAFTVPMSRVRSGGACLPDASASRTRM